MFAGLHVSDYHYNPRKLVNFLLIVLPILLLSPSLVAQTGTTGAITGTVTDSSGAVMPKVEVEVSNPALGQMRKTETSASGAYTIGLLPPGTYNVTFKSPGFSNLDIKAVAVQVTGTAVVNGTLKIGASEQIVVTSQASSLETISSTLGTDMGSQSITSLPLTTRNYTNLLGLTAGANSRVFNASTLGKGITDIAVNGATSSQNNTQMDGVSITNSAAAGTLTENGLNPGVGFVNPDAITEFKIQTSMFDASFGRNVGGNVNVVTKSGTNEFHGSAFEFLRNTDLNANDYFRKSSPPVNGKANNGRQVLGQNQYGGVFGGPIKKDKLYFFVSLQETGQKNGVAAQGSSAPVLPPVPTGDRSNTAAFQAALGAAICAAGTQTSIGGVQVACNGSNINPVAINLLQLKNPDGTYYIPSSGTAGYTSTTFSIPALFHERQVLGNADYVVNSKNSVAARYFYTDDPTTTPFSCGSGGGAPGICLPDTALVSEIGNQYALLRLTSLVTGNFLNEIRVSMQRNRFSAVQGNNFTDNQVGITPIVPQINYLDYITVAGNFTIGSTANVPSFKWITNIEGADQILWSHGKHTVKAGMEFERDQYNWHLIGLANGGLTFQTFSDLLIGLPGCAPGTSSAACAASAAAGTTNGTSSSNISSSGANTAVVPPQGVVHAFRETYADAFVQDDYKVIPRLTVNLGLRWEYDGLPYDKYGDASNVWPSLINTVPVPGTSAATGTLAGFVVPSNFNFANNATPPVGGVFQSNHRLATENNPSVIQFSPRLGFAWQPLRTSRLGLRGGYGVFRDRVGQGNFNIPMAQGEPYSTSVYQSGAANYYSSFAVPYSSIGLSWTPRWANINTATQTGTTSNLSVPILEEDYRTPMEQQWNLNVQYEFVRSWVLEVGYVGTHGTNLSGNTARQINEAGLASPASPINGITTNTVANAQSRVPYLGFTPAGLGEYNTDAASKFNSLQATVRKVLSHGVSLQAAYTYSQATSTAGSLTYNDPHSLVYARNSFYSPNRLTVNYSWDLPLGKHTAGLMQGIADGWNVSGVTIDEDGVPLTITDSRGGSIYGFGPGSPVLSTAQFAAGQGRANVASSGGLKARLGGRFGGSGYFNSAAFTTTPVIGNGTGYGNSGQSIILGPGQFNWDMTARKTNHLEVFGKDTTIQFRAEFFNTFNHPQFSNPAVVDVSKSTFGQITSSSVNPRMIQFGLKYAF